MPKKKSKTLRGDDPFQEDRKKKLSREMTHPTYEYVSPEEKTQKSLQGAALMTGAVPVVGDIAGLAADLHLYKNFPEERKLSNYGLTALGLLPFVAGAAGLAHQMGRQGGTPSRLQRMYPGQSGVIGYHGSPHKFDKFSMDKIGTGEGAQAYGHGLYFAESPEVAKAYRQALAGDEYIHIVNGKPIGEEALRGMSWAEKNAINALGRPDMYKPETLVERLRAEGTPEGKLKELSDALKKYSGKVKFERKDLGSMYKVDIDDNAVKNFLDWDKPLSQQSESTRKSLNDIFEGLNMDDYPRLKKILSSDPKGSDLYIALGDDIETANLLNDMEVKGIKYLDQGSRQAGKGTRNFVVFDEDIIKLLSRE